MDPLAPSIPGVRISRRLAIGGMAELFLGEQTLEGGGTRPVVVKRALPSADGTWAHLLAREREALLGLDSPFVVRCLGGEGDYLLLEHVDGPDLATLVRRRTRLGRPLPIPAALALVEAVARGLEDLHRAGYVHRDVNPSNVLLTAEGAVKLIDLGVVQSQVSSLPSVAGVKGTLAYMAPEQLRGTEADARADLYALGLVAYEVLTGVPARPPGTLGIADLLDVRSTLPAAPERLRPELGERLGDEVLAALAPEPDARPATVAEWRKRVLAAAVDAPDAIALGACVADVPRELAGPVERTVGPDALPPASMSTQVSRAEPASRRGSLLTALLALALAAAIGVAIWLGTRPGPEAPAPSAAASRATVAEASGPEPEVRPAEPEVLPAEPEVTPAEPEATPAEPEVAPAEPEVTPAEPDLGPEVTVAKVVTRKPTPTPRPTPTPKRSPAPAPAAPQAAARLTVASAGAGPVHVSGSGAKGLAPKTVSLTGGEAATLAVTTGTMKVRVRVKLPESGEGAASVSLGAPQGTFYTIACGGGAAKPTPRFGLKLQGSLRCRVTGPGGEAGAFLLRLAR